MAAVEFPDPEAYAKAYAQALKHHLANAVVCSQSVLEGCKEEPLKLSETDNVYIPGVGFQDVDVIPELKNRYVVAKNQATEVYRWDHSQKTWGRSNYATGLWYELSYSIELDNYMNLYILTRGSQKNLQQKNGTAGHSIENFVVQSEYKKNSKLYILNSHVESPKYAVEFIKLDQSLYKKLQWSILHQNIPQWEPPKVHNCCPALHKASSLSQENKDRFVYLINCANTPVLNIINILKKYRLFSKHEVERNSRTETGTDPVEFPVEPEEAPPVSTLVWKAALADIGAYKQAVAELEREQESLRGALRAEQERRRASDRRVAALRDVEAQLTGALASEAAARRRLSELEDELAQLQAALDHANASLEPQSYVVLYQSAQTRCSQLEHELQETQLAHKRLIQQFADHRVAASKDRTEAKEEAAKVTAELQKSKATLRAKHDEAAALRGEVAARDRELATLRKKRAAEFNDEVLATLQADIEHRDAQLADMRKKLDQERAARADLKARLDRIQSMLA